MYNEFRKMLDDKLMKFLKNNILIYGCNRGGDFIKWYFKFYHNKDIKAVIDRWELSPLGTIPHLWNLYYIYDENDIIINATPKDIIAEFNDTEENWEKTRYKQTQIYNLWEQLYSRNKINGEVPEITYYDWLEYKYDIDLLMPIKRKHTELDYAHGYFPTDFRIFMDALKKYHKEIKNESIFDIGCGKGSGIISLLAAGEWKKIGAIEYTEYIYDIMDSNLNKLQLSHQLIKLGEKHYKQEESGIICYKGDATALNEEFDEYTWFFLFNPFTWETMEIVFENICKSLKRFPRKIHIFYAEPITHQMIIDSRLFKVSDVICGNYAYGSYFSYIYESIDEIA
ncbi:MAG: class I SAM-dependent methyltransferase [Ruminococcus flavefaciens]|nr:class I SAM-dependent methyltransferase [Ruminococcus flavefaciens]